MNKCLTCGTQENIVYSGVDSLMLGVMDQIEKICYSCASEKARATQTN